LHNIAVHPAVHAFCGASNVGRVTVILDGSWAPLRAGWEKSSSNQNTFFVRKLTRDQASVTHASVRKGSCW